MRRHIAGFTVCAVQFGVVLVAAWPTSVPDIAEQIPGRKISSFFERGSYPARPSEHLDGYLGS
eukprot:453724-Rhodomonas_salina.1